MLHRVGSGGPRRSFFRKAALYKVNARGTCCCTDTKGYRFRLSRVEAHTSLVFDVPPA